MNITKKPTDHFEERKNGARPSFLIIHYTETQGPQVAEGYFTGALAHPTGGRVSTHYMIDENGSITQYVDEDKRAWHAGISYWDGNEDINSSSIGIELVNPGRKYGYRRFSAAQMQALVALAKDIVQRHNIPAHRVLGHSDVAPTRKVDPGELFDWKMLAAAGVGQWPEPTEEDYRIADDYLRSEQTLKEAFIKAGYDPKADMDSLIRAFRQHYDQDAFKSQNDPKVPNRQMAARLSWLVRNKPTL